MAIFLHNIKSCRLAVAESEFYMYFGVDYYPEHWPKERWAVDVKLMKDAGINLIRIAEFSWAKMEPCEGVWNFSWLDEVIQLFYQNGISVALCTPTATPPKWLIDRYPSICKQDDTGVQLGFGSRHHYCYNSAIFHQYTTEVVTKLAQRYGSNPAVVAWQIDNEFTCDDGLYCYCEECREAFIRWLQKKYGTLDALNNAWGTIFWSQTYTDWGQLIVPRRSQSACSINNGHNPALNLDYSRFQSDSIVRYSTLQIDIIRRWSKAPITHNMVAELFDYYKLGKCLDFVSHDNYPSTQWQQTCDAAPYDTAFTTDLKRGVKQQNIWIMEEQSGPCGWNTIGSTPRPGQIKKWTYQAMAHGAEGIVYFRWRACPFGVEQYWYGILDHDGIPRRRYEEIQSIGSTIQTVAAYNTGSHLTTDALLIYSFDQQWSHTFQQHNWNFNYHKYLKSIYAGFWQNHISLDISSEETDFAKYRLVLAPTFNLMSEELLTKYEQYVKNGGTLVITFRSGTKNMDNSMTMRTLPGYFKELAGIELEEFDSINKRQYQPRIKGIFGEGYATVWADIVKPITAETVAVYDSEFYAGKAAITVNQYGMGRCYYIGCDLDEKATNALAAYLAKECGISPTLDEIPDGVEVIHKIDSVGRDFWFAMNYAVADRTISFPFEVVNLETNMALGRQVQLSPYGCVAVTRA